MENVSVKAIEINDSLDLEKLCDTWKKIEKSEDMTIFQSYNWNCLLFEEEKKKRLSNFYTKIVVVVVEANDETVGILPLIIQKHGNKTKWFGRNKGLYILGNGSWSDYLNVVYSDSFKIEYFKALIDYLKENYKGYTFYITDVREHTKFADYLSSSDASPSESEVAVQVEKMESKEEYEKSLSKHTRQNLRTAKNRMDKAEIKYEVKVLGMIDDDDLIQKLIEVHVARMAEKNMVTTDLIHKISSHIRIRYRKKQEHRNNVVAESMKRMEESCLVIVYLNDDIAGYLYGLRDGSVIRIMQNCVLDEYKFYSPLFRGAYDFILDQYSDESIRVVDFTRGDEQYKYNLGGVEIKLGSWDVSL